MSYKDTQFRTPDPHYGVALAKSVQSDLITEEESNFIEIFQCWHIEGWNYHPDQT